MSVIMSSATAVTAGRSPTCWSTANRAHLVSYIVGRQWPQARLHTAGLAGDSWCQLCLHLRGQHATGTLAHRLWQCPLLHQTRVAVLPGHLQVEGDALPGQANYDPLSTVGVVLARGLGSISVAGIPAHPADTFVWDLYPTDGLWAGNFYTDGSGMDRDSVIGPYCERYAWSLVALRNDGSKQAAAYGSAPFWAHSVFTVELWAIMQAALAPCLGPVTVYTDCLSALQAWEAGALIDDAPSDLHAGLWRVIHGATLDRDFKIVWMPAHLDDDAIGTAFRSDGVTVSRSDLYGNRLADQLAQAAARSIRVPADRVRRLRSDLGKVTAAARAVASLCTAAASGGSGNDGSNLRDAAPLTAASRVTRVPSVVSSGVKIGCHMVVHTGGCYPWKCTVCSRAATSRPRLEAKVCVGSPDAKISALGHSLNITGVVRWCSVCGAYSTRVARALLKPCKGRPVSKAQRVRLALLHEGRHPVSRKWMGP